MKFVLSHCSYQTSDSVKLYTAREFPREIHPACMCNKMFRFLNALVKHEKETEDKLGFFHLCSGTNGSIVDTVPSEIRDIAFISQCCIQVYNDRPKRCYNNYNMTTQCDINLLQILCNNPDILSNIPPRVSPCLLSSVPEHGVCHMCSHTIIVCSFLTFF